MSTAERWLDRTISSEQDVVAFRQSMLDWQYEVSLATTTRGRIQARVRSIVAMFRVGAFIAARDVVQSVASPWGWCFAAWTIVLAWAQFDRVHATSAFPQAFADVENVHRLIGSLAAGLSVAGFLTVAFAPPNRRAPLLGLTLFALTMSVLVDAVAGPASWQRVIATEQAPNRSFAPWSWIPVLPLIASAAIGLLAGDAIRRDRRRWLALGCACALVFAAKALPPPVDLALFLNDRGLIGDTVYLPVFPQWLAQLRSSAWPLPVVGCAVILAGAWRQSRKSVA